MRIGVFDSGLGGLITLKGLVSLLPEYDYVYLGDVKYAPYGHKTKEEIIERTIKAVQFLFDQDCLMVILACNSSSVSSLEEVRSFFQDKYPDHRIFGAFGPMVKKIKGKIVGVLGAKRTIDSHVYKNTSLDLFPEVHVIERYAKNLATYIENGEVKEAQESVKKHIEDLREDGIDTLLLACTHYPILKSFIKEEFPTLYVLSPDKEIPEKLSQYLDSRTERASKLSKNSQQEFYLTEMNDLIPEKAKKWFGKEIEVKEVNI
jgi:glutamate racemase